MKLIFEWDERKGRDNRMVHKVGFQEAKAVFNDPFLISFPDDVHSVHEERLLSIGTSIRGRVLLVVHTESYEEDGVIVVRIISARKATTSERRVCEENKD
jgi:uncharacterized DUF497 family protein